MSKIIIGTSISIRQQNSFKKEPEYMGILSFRHPGPSFSMSATTLSDFLASPFAALETGLIGGDTFWRGGCVNFALTTFPSI